jgi:hypothetical protein
MLAIGTLALITVVGFGLVIVATFVVAIGVRLPTPVRMTLSPGTSGAPAREGRDEKRERLRPRRDRDVAQPRHEFTANFSYFVIESRMRAAASGHTIEHGVGSRDVRFTITCASGALCRQCRQPETRTQSCGLTASR